jgi:DNA-binding MarR family transcriptional regulator
VTNLDLFKPPQEIRELNLLQELEKNPIISQRELSHKFGIALGVTNACLKRMARRGWIRVVSLDRRRIGYYLTPKGFVEKSKLSLHLFSWTIQHYAAMKDTIGEKFLEMQNNGIERVVFYGVSDEMEVAYITLQGVNLKLVGIVDDDENFRPQIIFGFELEPVSQIQDLNPHGVLITSLERSTQRKERLKVFLDEKKVYIADIVPSPGPFDRGETCRPR